MLTANPPIPLTVFSALLSFALVSSHAAQGQTVEVLATTDLSSVDCGEAMAQDRVVRSPALVSPNGQYRAYGEVGTRATRDTQLAWCANRSKLFVGSASSRVLRQVYEEEPTYWMRGNGIRLVDWSADSRYLLVELWRWQYYSDTIGTSILVYDSEKDLFLVPDLDRLFSRRFGRECWLDIRLLGFASDNRVAFEAEDNEMLGSACLEKKSRWLLEPTRGDLMRIPEDYKLSTYGKLDRSSHKQ